MTDTQFTAWLQSSDCIRCVLVEAVARIAGAETTLYLASRNYVTGAADTPANTAYESCVSGGVRFSEQLVLDGSPSLSWGDIELDNRGGMRDGWLNYVWAGRRVRAWIGDPRWPRADFRLVFDGVIADISARGADVLNLALLNKAERLNVPVSEATLGGSTANAGALLPLAFGECANVTPLLSDPASLEYRVHTGAIERVIEVRDNGVPVTYAAALGTGTFVLGAAPAGAVTASVQGDKPTAYANTVSALVQRLATGYGPAVTRFTAADVDDVNFAAFAAACPQPVGLYAAERTNLLAACQQLAASVGAQVVVTSQGLLRLVRIALPADGTPVDVGPEDMEYHGISIAQRPAVRAAVALNYCRNWTVQPGGLAGGLPAEHAALYAQEWLTVTQSDSAVAAVYKLDAAPPAEDTLLLTDADATAEAARRLALWSVPRTVYRVACRAHLLLTELGDAVTLTHPRFGLAAGAAGQVLTIERDWLAGRVTLGVLC